MSERTKAEEEAVRVMQRRLADGSRYRVGAILLGYRDEDGDTRVAHGVGIQTGSTLVDSAPELAAVVGCLGILQTEMNEIIAGKRPLSSYAPERHDPWAWKRKQKR